MLPFLSPLSVPKDLRSVRRGDIPRRCRRNFCRYMDLQAYYVTRSFKTRSSQVKGAHPSQVNSTGIFQKKPYLYQISNFLVDLKKAIERGFEKEADSVLLIESWQNNWSAD